MADPFEIFVGNFQYVGTKNSGKALRLTVAWRLYSAEYGILGQRTPGCLILRNKNNNLVFHPQKSFKALNYSKPASDWTLDLADLILNTVKDCPIGRTHKYIDFIGSVNSQPWKPPKIILPKEPQVVDAPFTEEDNKGLWIDKNGSIRRAEEFFEDEDGNLIPDAN